VHNLKIEKTSIDGVLIVQPVKHADERGYFSETFNKKNITEFENLEFVQDNQSLSKEKYTFRGLHFQTPPFAQDKLVRVLKGAILDIVLDLRKESKTYGKHATIEITDTSFKQIFIPKNLAHGFLTMRDNTEVFYKVTNYYSKQHEFGIDVFDKDLNISLPVGKEKIFLSKKDKMNFSFIEAVKYFA
jgi:dTDP-4-dehydrorhamnose 3,5-epimerase